jgi:hypothetical protein
VANTKRPRPLTRVAVGVVALMMVVMAGLMLSPGLTARAVDA